MPIWHIHHHPSAFTAEQKEALASSITDWYYGRGLPRFYVIVLFHASDSIFRSGRLAGPKFLRFEMVHIARQGSPDDKARAMAVQEEWHRVIFEQHVVQRGFEWEYSYQYTPRAFWRVDGLVPPAEGSEAEKLWKDEDRAVPYDHS